jgi:hypothetical protein
MTALFAVGKSSYGELAGITQYVTNAEVAAQVNSLIEESRGVFAGGAFLSVNEGNRSKARQRYLRSKWEAYRAGGPWAALAAALYFSTHDESRGNALDFGVTNRDGSNRALTMSEHAWLVARGKLRGIVWTGGDPTFMSPPESWHFNGYPQRATIPPLVLTPKPPKKEYDMPLVVRATQSGIVPAGTKLMVQIGESHDVAEATLDAYGIDAKPVNDATLKLVLRDHAIPTKSARDYSVTNAVDTKHVGYLGKIAKKLGVNLWAKS